MRRHAGWIVTAALTALGLLAGTLAGQEAPENRMGFMGGLTFATWGGEATNHPDWRLGGDVGVFISWLVDDPWAIRSGLYYVRKGIAESDADGDAVLRLDYLEIPLLLEYRLVSNGRLGAHLFGGPAVALKLSCSVEAMTATGPAMAQCPIFGMYPKDVDAGAMVGAGASLAVSDGLALLLEGRFNLGLSSIDASPARADVRNRAFQINVGVVIPTGDRIGRSR